MYLQLIEANQLLLGLIDSKKLQVKDLIIAHLPGFLPCISLPSLYDGYYKLLVAKTGHLSLYIHPALPLDRVSLLVVCAHHDEIYARWYPDFHLMDRDNELYPLVLLLLCVLMSRCLSYSTMLPLTLDHPG
jgi:hypothetical protein